MTKHININLNFTREKIESRIVIKKVASEDNKSNVLTNSLPGSKFKI